MTDSNRWPVAVVVDSTSDLPPAEIARHGIAVVPLTVTFGDRSFRDGVDLTAARFIDELKASSVTPTTSQPPVTAFADVFQDAIDAGQDIFCLTIAAKLSGTHNVARLAAESLEPERIRIVDSGTVTMHAGVAAIAAARAAAAGAGLDGVEAAACDSLRRGQIFVVLETLEYLRRGGRIGKAQALVGGVLNLKPVLTIRDGEVVPLERIRTWRKALDRIAELVREQAPLESLAVYHAGNLADAQAIADRLADLVPGGDILLGEVGPVVATYAGPGAVGVMPVRRG